MTPFTSAAITGASSGLGRALAMALAGPGVRLHLAGRNEQRLAAVASKCEQSGATVRTQVLDVREASAVAEWLGSSATVELVIANAGISAGTAQGIPEGEPRIRSMFATNVDGVVSTVLAAMALLSAQPPNAGGIRGHIVVIASLAAFVPAPTGPAYCASKAAVDLWTVASAPAARQRGILLTSVCPGYIRTPMTEANQFAMPGLMDADRAARIILRAASEGRVRIAFPWWLAVAARAAGLLPPSVLGRLLGGRPGEAPQSGS
ncbi:MAG: SDR family NAD(P)-dependent oxidoreductase [Acetobacteraceae bacterium]|nr:SDR family NAD(P)-dependent oxidoreductase [Acetobacteraceae bacterium]